MGRVTEGPSRQQVEGNFILNNDTNLGSEEGVVLGLQFQILGSLGAPWSPHPKPGEHSPHGAQCQPTCFRTCHRQSWPKSLLLGRAKHLWPDHRAAEARGSGPSVCLPGCVAPGTLVGLSELHLLSLPNREQGCLTPSQGCERSAHAPGPGQADCSP